MPSTPRGLPYPNATDPVSLGASDIQALAEAVDPALASVGALVGLSAAPTIPNDAYQTLSFDVEFYDTHGFHTAAQLPRLVVPAGLGGIYTVSMYWSWVYSGGGTLRLMQINFSDNPSWPMADRRKPANEAGGSLSFTRYFAAGAYVECSAYQDSGGGLAVQPAYFSIARVGVGAVTLTKDIFDPRAE
jgi:hypothetical protein